MMIKKYEFKLLKKAFSLVELSIVLLIISLIIAGVIGADLIISKARISSAKTLTQSSPIAAQRSLDIWLEPSLDSSFEESEAEDGAAVGVWKDNNPGSIIKKNATQSEGDDKPTYANTINRIHAIKFNGSNSNFVVDGSALNDNDYTIVVVEKRLSNKTENYFLGDSSVTTENESLLLGYSTNSTVLYSQGGSNSHEAMTDTFETNGKPKVFVFMSDVNGKRTYINGILASSSSDTTKLSNIGNLNIGKGYNGEIGEVAIFTKGLDDFTRRDIEKYLSKKYTIDAQTSSNIDCTSGTITSSGCNVEDCSVSVTGSSAGTVSSGSGTISCDSSGYSGTVSYTCSAGDATTSGTCSCGTGYTLESGSCVATTCSISSVTGFNDKTSLAYAESATAISSACATGYSGSPTYTCTSAGAASISGSCSAITCSITSVTGFNNKTGLAYAASATAISSACASGYTGSPTYTCTSSGAATISGSCVADGPCSISGVTGINNGTSVSSGTGNLNCNATGYNSSDSVNYSCSGGSFSVTSGFCNSCSSGYSYVSGQCRQQCTASGTGITTATVGYTTNSTQSCDAIGYNDSDSITYKCVGGIFTKLSGSCNSCASGFTYSGGACTGCAWTQTQSGATGGRCFNDIGYSVQQYYTCDSGMSGKHIWTTDVTSIYSNGAYDCCCSGSLSCSSTCGGSAVVGSSSSLTVYRCDCI